MGNWDVLHHIFECSSEKRAHEVYARLGKAGAHDWIDDKRWGLRYGFVSPTLLVASTSQKWGSDLEFADFVVNGTSGVATTQLLENEGEVITPPSNMQRTLQIRWDYVFWHSRTETLWDKTPIRTIPHAPPEYCKVHIQSAIQESGHTNQNPLLFCLSRKDEIVRSSYGGPGQHHQEALFDEFAALHNTGPHIEDTTYLVFGAVSPQHGPVHFGYLTVGGFCESPGFFLSLGSNTLDLEVWAGPYTTPIRDDLLLPASPIVDDITACFV